MARWRGLLVPALLLGIAIGWPMFLRRERSLVLPEPSIASRERAARLERDVRELAERIGPRHAGRPAALAAAQTYVADAFAAAGWNVNAQAFDALGTTVANIEAAGDQRAAAYFVAGAHYDTLPGTPGANDNASGVAVLLELARVFGPTPPQSLRLVAFVNEEPPWFQTPLMGSVVYAGRARARADQVLGMVSLETMGYYSTTAGSQRYPPPLDLLFPSTGNFLAAVANVRSTSLLRQFASSFRRASPLPLIASPAPERIPGIGWSDHWSFWQEGYRALMLTDTAPYRYPHYHAASDTPDKLDYGRLALAVEGVAAALDRIVGR